MSAIPHTDREDEGPITVTCPKCHGHGSRCSLCVAGRVTLHVKQRYRERPERTTEPMYPEHGPSTGLGPARETPWR